MFLGVGHVHLCHLIESFTEHATRGSTQGNGGEGVESKVLLWDRLGFRPSSAPLDVGLWPNCLPSLSLDFLNGKLQIKTVTTWMGF